MLFSSSSECGIVEGLNVFFVKILETFIVFFFRMWRAFNPLSCLLLVAVASKAAPTGDEAGRLSQARSSPPFLKNLRTPARVHLVLCT